MNVAAPAAQALAAHAGRVVLAHATPPADPGGPPAGAIAPVPVAVDAYAGADLLARAAAVRARLAARGVGPGDRVALLAPGVPDWVACDLGALAQGAVLVPLDPRLAAADRALILADCRPALVVHAGADGAPSREADLAGLPADLPRVALAELAAPGDVAWTDPVPRAADDPATIVYTSGSTGPPKGAVLGHGGLEHVLAHVTERLAGLTGRAPGEDQALSYLPPCYAGSRVFLHACLRRAARTALVTDPARLLAAWAPAAPDYVLNVPLLLERVRRGAREAIGARGALPARLLAAAEAAWDRLEDAREAAAASGAGGGAGPRPALRDRLVLALARRALLAKVRARLGPRLVALICGSAPLAPETQRFFRLLGVEVYQGYGLTETTALCTLDLEGRVRPGWVGPALPGVELRLGAEGEVETRGPHVFLGYWGRDVGPGAGAGPPPWRSADGWLGTGDLGEVDAAGRWRVLGRKNAMLVLSTGHNVPPEAVEDALRARLPGDAQVVVLGHGRPHLVALVWVGPGVEDAAIERAVAEHTAAASPARRVHAWARLRGPLTVEDGLLTANLKLRRPAIAERLAALVDALYARGVSA